MDEFRKRGVKMYRQFLKDDLMRMKVILDGLRYIEAEDMLLEYKRLASQCLSWKRLIKLNK